MEPMPCGKSAVTFEWYCCLFSLIPALSLKIVVEGIAFVGLYAAELFLLRRDRIGFILEAMISRPDSNPE